MPDTEQAQQKAREAAGQAKGRISEQVDQRSTQAGQQVNTVAQDVRSVAQELRTQGKDKPAQYAEQAAERVQSAGQWLEQKNGDELMRDVENFARRNPWAVAAGGLVLGLAASRMLKASSTERYRSTLSNGYGSYGRTGGYATGTYGRTGTYSGAGELASEPMPSGAPTTGSRLERDESTLDTERSMISTEPRP